MSVSYLYVLIRFVPFVFVSNRPPYFSFCSLFVERMLLLTGAQRKKYLDKVDKHKNLDGYVSSDPVGLKLRSLKRKEPAAKGDVEVGDLEMEDLEGVGDAVVIVDSPRSKKTKAGKGKMIRLIPWRVAVLERLHRMPKLLSLSGILSLIFVGTRTLLILLAWFSSYV